MIEEIRKPLKIALCRKCHGTGRVRLAEETESAESSSHTIGSNECTCPQCEGSGRVTVTCQMTLDIRPYKTNRKT